MYSFIKKADVKFINSLKTYAEFMLAATAILLFFITINETGTSTHAGILLLLPGVYFIVFMWLGWIRPWETGIALTLLGVVVILFLRGLPLRSFNWPIIGGALSITGLLFLLEGRKPHDEA